MLKKLSFLYISFFVTACGGGAGEILGGGAPPDETTVVATPSLTVPPNFALRPPRTGDSAREDLLRRAPSIAPIDNGVEDAWLLQNANKSANTRVDENIREDLTPPPEPVIENQTSDENWWNIWGNAEDATSTDSMPDDVSAVPEVE